MPHPFAPCCTHRYVDWVYSRCIEYPGQISSGTQDQEGLAASSSSDGSGATADGAAQNGAATASPSGKSAREVALTGGVDQVLVRRLTRDFSLERLRCAMPCIKA